MIGKKRVTCFLAQTFLLIMGYTFFNPVLAQEKPNIVWIMAEDIGTDLACYGTKGLQTPNIDKLATEGMRLTRAYTTNPICSPSRSSMMTGMHQNSIDTHNHRSHRSDGYKLPQPMTTMTSMLREQGYFTANGNGYNNKTDLNFNLRSNQKPLFDGKDWSERQNGQPFYAQITLYKTHRNNTINNWEKIRKNSPDPVAVDKIELPPYLPDKPEVRYDWALYLDQMEHVDGQVGKIVQRLKNENILQKTMVIFIGDNGRCQIRGKGYLYECGINIPAIIRYPAKISNSVVSDELVPMIDIVAQILYEAGVSLPSYMQGRPFLENSVPDRDFVFAARDRWDEIMEKSRTVVGRKFKLIRNDMPLIPYDANQVYLNNAGVRPILPQLRRMYENGELNEIQAHFFKPNKPPIELYDLENDPWETENLALDSSSQTMIDSLMKEITQWEQSGKDLGRIPEDPNVLDKTVKPRFDANPHMQKYIRSFPLTLQTQSTGTVKASYSGIQDINGNEKVRYGFEIYIDAFPSNGYKVESMSSPDVNGIFDSLHNRFIFFMPLKQVTVEVKFGPATFAILKEIKQYGHSWIIYKNNRIPITINYHTSFAIYDLLGRKIFISRKVQDLIPNPDFAKKFYLFSLENPHGNEQSSYGKLYLVD